MKDVCDEVLEVSEQLYRDWNLHLRLDSAFQNDGWMEQDFIKSDFGRLFGTGLSSLQSMPKEILKRVLNGCYELDVNTASLVILTEIHRRRFRVSSFSAIERFIRLKTWIREEVARSLEIDVSTVKTAFTAIGFGMRSNTKSYFNENGDIEVPTLTKTFGGDFRKSQEFLAHSEVKEFWMEMKNLFKELSSDSKNELSELKPSHKDGLSHGQGTQTYADGSKYAGEWKNDKLHGKGTFTNSDGQVLKGIYIDGELVGKQFE